MNLYLTYGTTSLAASGRHEFADGKWILYAGGERPSVLDAAFNRGRGNFARAEGALSDVTAQSKSDVEEADVVYVYVGVNGMEKALALIERLISQGKNVILTGCDCMAEEKRAFARRHGIESILVRECGGRGILTQLIKGSPIE